MRNVDNITPHLDFTSVLPARLDRRALAQAPISRSIRTRGRLMNGLESPAKARSTVEPMVRQADFEHSSCAAQILSRGSSDSNLGSTVDLALAALQSVHQADTAVAIVARLSPCAGARRSRASPANAQ